MEGARITTRKQDAVPGKRSSLGSQEALKGKGKHRLKDIAALNTGISSISRAAGRSSSGDRGIAQRVSTSIRRRDQDVLCMVANQGVPWPGQGYLQEPGRLPLHTPTQREFQGGDRDTFKEAGRLPLYTATQRSSRTGTRIPSGSRDASLSYPLFAQCLFALLFNKLDTIGNLITNLIQCDVRCLTSGLECGDGSLKFLIMSNL